MPSANPEPPRRPLLERAGLSPLVAFVTLVALLLIARIEVRSLEARSHYPLLSLDDPVRSLFLYAEEQRRIVQSGTIPDVPIFRGPCSACNAASLAKRWYELSEESLRYLQTGHRLRDVHMRWLRDVEAASAISLAGWGRSEDRKAAAELYNKRELPDYLSTRAEEFARGNVESERARVARAGRNNLLSMGVHSAFILFALGVALAWKFGLAGLRRARRARLAAPNLGKGLVLFIWAEGFVSVLRRLRWDNPDGPLEIFRALPSLALAISISVLLLGTRAKSSATPIKDLLRCPVARRQRLLYGVGAFASLGAIYAFNLLHFWMLHRLQFSTSWSDGIREAVLYGSLGRALLAQSSAVILAPYAEELTYRGVLFGSLATRMSPHRAALISSVVFAAIHGYDWFGFVSVAFSGYLWARLAERFGSLVPGMLAHGTCNLIIGIFKLAARA